MNHMTFCKTSDHFESDLYAHGVIKISRRNFDKALNIIWLRFRFLAWYFFARCRWHQNDTKKPHGEIEAAETNGTKECLALEVQLSFSGVDFAHQVGGRLSLKGGGNAMLWMVDACVYIVGYYYYSYSYSYYYYILFFFRSRFFLILVGVK